jgi:hypothetical protein
MPVRPGAYQARFARWKAHFRMGISKGVPFVTFFRMYGVLLGVRNRKERCCV